jgi:hypothetical protein
MITAPIWCQGWRGWGHRLTPIYVNSHNKADIMSNKAAGIIVILAVIVIALSGGFAGYIDLSVDSGNADGIPDNGISWGSGGPDAHDYNCSGTGRNVVCSER